MRQPVVSVIVVSDYNSATQRTWHDERACLEAVAAQDLKEPFEVIISEDDKYRNTFPDELLSIVPGSRVVFSKNSSSYGLKNSGARAAESPIVVLLDADCKPDSDWLRIIVDTMRAHPEVGAVSGRTFYEGKGLDTRVLALLSRSYLDPGVRGETSFVSNNAGAFRREVFLKHTLPETLGAFSSRIQSEAMKRDGCVLWFEPDMRVVHEFEGWPMEADIRRNIGYGTIVNEIGTRRTVCRDDSLPHVRF